MNLNPINLATTVWSKAHSSTSQMAADNILLRWALGGVIFGAMIAIGVTMYQTFSLIKLGKVDVVVGTLLGGIFTFFGGILAVAIPALVTAMRGPTKAVVDVPDVPPPTIVTPTNGDNA